MNDIIKLIGIASILGTIAIWTVIMLGLCINGVVSLVENNRIIAIAELGLSIFSVLYYIHSIGVKKSWSCK
jgi:hypothetical protein